MGILYGKGLKDGSELERTKLEVEDLKRQFDETRKGLEDSKNSLSVLLGRPPGALDLGEGKGLPDVPTEVLLLLPVDVIKHRPDVRKAEKQLVLAQASLGLSRLDRLPSLSLSWALGLQAPRLIELLSGPTRLIELSAI